jgi:peroxin-2
MVNRCYKAHCSRIFQFDAVELDEEIVKILKHQVVNVIKYIGFGFLGRWEPEVDALLRFIIWKVCMSI